MTSLKKDEDLAETLSGEWMRHDERKESLVEKQKNLVDVVRTSAVGRYAIRKQGFSTEELKKQYECLDDETQPPHSKKCRLGKPKKVAGHFPSFSDAPDFFANRAEFGSPWNDAVPLPSEYTPTPAGSFGRRVTVMDPIISFGIYQGKLKHEILGKLRVTLKLLRVSQRVEAARYFMVPDHPNITKRITTAMFSHLGGNNIYIAMEECHHQNLHDYVQSQIRDGVPFDTDKYLSYSYQIALAVEFLHRHEIIVGMLRPDKILLSTDKTTIKICEFGFGRSIWPPSAEGSVFFPLFNEPFTNNMSTDIGDLGSIYRYLWSYKFPKSSMPYLSNERDHILLPNSNSARSLIDRMTASNLSSRPSVAEVVRHEIFKHLAAGPSEDKHTSTDDLLASVTTEGVITLIDAESGVVTRFANLSGGIAISKSIRKVIGLDNEQLDVGGCSAIFPSGSFTESTPVNVRAEINGSKLPKNFTGYTPILYVDAAGLKGKVRVKLPSWRINNQPEKAEARILHIPKGGTEWEDTNVTLPITDKPYFEFEWQDFSPITIGGWFGSNIAVDYRIAGSVYVSNTNEVSIAYHINDKITPTSESLASEAVEKLMGSATPPKKFKIRLKQFTVKPGDTIETQVSCEDPSELMFRPKDPFTFTVDQNFAEGLFVEDHGVVMGSLEEIQLVYMQCMVFKKSGQEREKVGNSAMFTCDWTPRKRRAIEQKEEMEGTAPLMGNVSFNLQGPKTDHSRHHVMTKTYANQEAKIQFSESDSTTTVTSSGVSSKQNKGH